MNSQQTMVLEKFWESLLCMRQIFHRLFEVRISSARSDSHHRTDTRFLRSLVGWEGYILFCMKSKSVFSHIGYLRSETEGIFRKIGKKLRATIMPEVAKDLHVQKEMWLEDSLSRRALYAQCVFRWKRQANPAQIGIAAKWLGYWLWVEMTQTCFVYTRLCF